jgi:SAM-dependent methyltransferase
MTSERRASDETAAPRDEPGRSADSAARSRAFYRALGATGLAIRTKPEWDAQAVEALRRLLPPAGRILDAGCGYGRIAIPLAELGYDVTGIDVSPNLLRAARREARRRRVAVRFDAGSMTALPYTSASFDAVISMWTAFHELLGREEQLAALSGMHRVLRRGGLGIIDGPVSEPPAGQEITGGRRFGPDGRTVTEIIAGRRIRYVVHDRASLESLADAAGIPSWDVVEQELGGRLRQVFLFRR